MKYVIFVYKFNFNISKCCVQWFNLIKLNYLNCNKFYYIHVIYLTILKTSDNLTTYLNVHAFICKFACVTELNVIDNYNEKNYYLFIIVNAISLLPNI